MFAAGRDVIKGSAGHPEEPRRRTVLLGQHHQLSGQAQKAHPVEQEAHKYQMPASLARLHAAPFGPDALAPRYLAKIPRDPIAEHHTRIAPRHCRALTMTSHRFRFMARSLHGNCPATCPYARPWPKTWPGQTAIIRTAKLHRPSRRSPPGPRSPARSPGRRAFLAQPGQWPRGRPTRSGLPRPPRHS